MKSKQTRICEILAKYQPPNSWPNELVDELVKFAEDETKAGHKAGRIFECDIASAAVQKLADDLKARHPKEKTSLPKIKAPPFPLMPVNPKP